MAAACSASALGQGKPFEGEIEYTLGHVLFTKNGAIAEPVTTNVKVYHSSTGAMRVEGEKHTILVPAKGRKQYLLSDSARTATVFENPDMRGAFQVRLDTARKTIEGYECYGFSIWANPERAVAQDREKEYVHSVLVATQMPVVWPESGHPLLIGQHLPGMPLQIMMARDWAGEYPIYSFKKMERKSLPAGLFQVPKGYKEVPYKSADKKAPTKKD